MPYALFVMQLAIIGYVVFNVSVNESSGLASLGLMNLGCGVFSALFFWKHIKGRPDFFVAALGAAGVLFIATGLKVTHHMLADPANTMVVIYELLVFGSLWVSRWTPFLFGRYQLSSTPVNQKDLHVYLILLVLVVCRLVLHWRSDWSFEAFVWASVAIGGYWLFLASIQLSKSTVVGEAGRATNVTMNLFAGVGLLVLAFIFDSKSFSSIGLPSFVGTASLVLIVWSMGESFVSWGKLKMVGFVTPGVYEGLIIQAPFAMWLWYGQVFQVLDWPISLGMVAVFAYHFRSKVQKV